MEVCEEMLEQEEETEEEQEEELSLTVVLPNGTEEVTTVYGSKPVMDMLVALCAEHHLNPSEHAMELISANQNLIKFKPNSLIGSLEAERVVLKHRGDDYQPRKKREPYVPEVSVRLLIFYRKSHRAVVRVSPKVALRELLPAICDRCEFPPEHTLLFLNSQSEEPLDFDKTLNDYGIRELFAKDTRVILTPPELVVTADTEGSKENLQPVAPEKKERKESKGFLSIFRIRKKKSTQNVSSSAPNSPPHQKRRTLSLGLLSFRTTQPAQSHPGRPSKKRRAPMPPLPNLLNSHSLPAHLNSSLSTLNTHTATSATSSAESTLRRTKRRAPPPPVSIPPASTTECEPPAEAE